MNPEITKEAILPIVNTTYKDFNVRDIAGEMGVDLTSESLSAIRDVLYDLVSEHKIQIMNTSDPSSSVKFQLIPECELSSRGNLLSKDQLLNTFFSKDIKIPFINLSQAEKICSILFAIGAKWSSIPNVIGNPALMSAFFGVSIDKSGSIRPYLKKCDENRYSEDIGIELNPLSLYSMDFETRDRLNLKMESMVDLKNRAEMLASISKLRPSDLSEQQISLLAQVMRLSREHEEYRSLSL
jgi:hypothetical protein